MSSEQPPPPPPPPPPPSLPPPAAGSAYAGKPSRVGKNKPVGLSVVALVVSILGCCGGLLGLIIGLVALNKASRGINGGKLMAQIAVLISVFWLLLTVVGGVIGFKLMTFRDASGHFAKEGYTFAYGLEAGDCIQKPNSAPLFVKAVPCGIPHETEIFAMLPRPAGTSDEEAFAACEPYFKDYVGIKLERSELQLTPITIASSQFNTTGRTACLVGMKNEEQTAGTLRNSKR